MSEEARLRWKCRRGMRELDVLMLRFLAEDFPRAGQAEQTGFLRLLEMQDPDIFALVMGRNDSEDKDIQVVVQKIRHAFSA